MKQRVNKYTKEKGQEILQLNNDISNKKTELEKINDEMKDLKDDAEEVAAKKLGKVSEFAQILMAINNIEAKCTSMQSLKLRHTVSLTVKKPPDSEAYNDLASRGTYAKFQLRAIGTYIKDYKAITEGLQAGNFVTNPSEQNEVREFINNLKMKNEYI
jgi:seryl-tRNA synthetase